MNMIINLARGEKVSDSMIQSELYEICDREHSSCNEAYVSKEHKRAQEILERASHVEVEL